MFPDYAAFTGRFLIGWERRDILDGIALNTFRDTRDILMVEVSMDTQCSGLSPSIVTGCMSMFGFKNTKTIFECASFNGFIIFE